MFRSVSNLAVCVISTSRSPTLWKSSVGPCSILQSRNYAKGKNKPSGKGKKKVIINMEEINSLVDGEKYKQQLSQLLDQMKTDLIKQFSARTSAGGIDNLPVALEGDMYPLHEVASIGRKSPQLLVLNCSAFPSATAGVLKTLKESGMGLNPQQEGTTIYVPIPKVTREHREQLAKGVKNLCNRYKEKIRDVHNHNTKQARGNADVSQDLIFNVVQQIDLIAEQHSVEAEKLMKAKQKELLGEV